MNVSECLKRLRIESGLTQAELGEQCGMKDSAIRRYENGRANPKLETIKKISDAICSKLSDIDYEFFEEISTASENDDRIKIILQSIVNRLNDVYPETFHALSKSGLELIESHRTSAFLNFINSLGYTFVDGNSYDSDFDEVGMIEDKKNKVYIPLTREQFKLFRSSIENTVDYEVYKLTKSKGL